MLNFKVWLLNLKRISEIDGTSFGEYIHDMFPISIDLYDFYKVFDSNPEHHMLYSTKYLEKTSVLTLLFKHYQWQSTFKYWEVRARW